MRGSFSGSRLQWGFKRMALFKGPWCKVRLVALQPNPLQGAEVHPAIPSRVQALRCAGQMRFGELRLAGSRHLVGSPPHVLACWPPLPLAVAMCRVFWLQVWEPGLLAIFRSTFGCFASMASGCPSGRVFFSGMPPNWWFCFFLTTTPPPKKKKKTRVPSKKTCPIKV